MLKIRDFRKTNEDGNPLKGYFYIFGYTTDVQYIFIYRKRPNAPTYTILNVKLKSERKIAVIGTLRCTHVCRFKVSA